MGFLAQCAMLLDPFSTFDLNVLQCLSEGFLWTGFKPFFWKQKWILFFLK